MSHITGTVQILGAPLSVTPGATVVFNPPAAPGGTKLLLLHFQNPNFKPGDELRVKLGYATDVFTAADGPAFWTRPINVYAFPAGVEITYVAAGPATGSIQLDRYGRGERHAGETGHPSFSNSDPFFQAPAYVEPTYDPFWYCANPPHWDNIAVVSDANDVRARVARSVGMIVSVEGSNVSTCSVTLVDADKIISAGHCHTPDEALTSSVCFDYQTLADGSRPPGYNPRFYKVKAVIKHQNVGSSLDYSLLQLAESPAGVPAIQLRHDFPLVGEFVFGVHHPNGAVKKLSLPLAEGFASVTGSSAGGINVPSAFHVSGGSSGSGLFDMAGRIVGVLSRGAPCTSSTSPLAYCPTPNVLADLVPTAPPAVSRDVMLVFDRSGSMSMDDGSGRKKIDAARDAVALFVELVRAGTGNRMGLVSFSTTASAPVDLSLRAVDNTAKLVLVGPAPHIAGIVGGLAPSGATTIFGGLDAARQQFPMAGANPRAILLLTDGLHNTPPDAATVEPQLTGITLHAIGFGSESNLDGNMLHALTTAHGGLYMRAGGGLALEKFFSSAFGNIFEAGVLFDPEFDLPADQRAGTPIAFQVCGEDTLTAVVGWDRTDASLLLELTTPGGVLLDAGTPTVTSATGRTWTFLRVPLPVVGERNGAWRLRVVRPGGGGEFPPPAPALRYFVNVIPSGGPKLLRQPDAARYYTGDDINPVMLLRYADGGWPEDIDMQLTLTRPDASVGNLLAASGLGAAGSIDADGIPARQATLMALEAKTGKPVVRYTQAEFDLADDSASTRGLFESGGTFGLPLHDLLDVEGNFSFHVKAQYGAGCLGSREHLWSMHVDIGIDPGRTGVSTTPVPGSPDGSGNVRVSFTPRDRYGNLLGPGRLDGFTTEPVPGSRPIGPVTDLGNGSYQVDVRTDPGTLGPPQVGLAQPGRPTAVITPPDFKLYIYGVKFVCGTQADADCGCAPVRPGCYATEINIHNPTDKLAPVLMRPVPVVVAGAPSGREPKSNGPGKASVVNLPGHGATMSDCCRILELVLGAAPAGVVPLTVGFLEIVSTVDLDVTAVYTATGAAGSTPSISVQRVMGRPFQA